MSYKTSNAEGHVDFINTYDLEPMAQQVILKQHLAISLVGRKILSL
ncbi:L-lactate dehydrogenase (FMN-dependent)-like alpha-hydroxy acid dehydrogenase [Streptococcus pneumoniae]|nr:L-lactate dehydrogenase (FMN-dependent)-like alpha-hydroxy acid dehydrogenase [Streptococcus pneumoniae]CZC56581.1 L-lactate dehydrogenase (FMN-dependent)-like alpha-hydroxy acid dehydrogenase [Streptococcus pneumoniae]